MNPLNPEVMKMAKATLTTYGVSAFKAIVVLYVGFKAIRILCMAFSKTMEKRDVDISLRAFLNSVLAMILKAGLVISVAGMVGIHTTSFVAILGAAGLAVGMALQGSLANFAGGVLILLFRPFKVGDYISACGHEGTVKEIQIFCTILLTADRKTIILPNGPVASGSMVNYSKEPMRRVDMTFGIGYEDDLKKAKEILRDLVSTQEGVLSDPAFEVHVLELADSSVNFTVRAFVKSADYWKVFFSMQERVKLKFDEMGISIPYPQRDIHLFQKN